MSHTVARGKPNAAQIHLDTILKALLEEKGLASDSAQVPLVTLPQTLYYCLKRRPDSTSTINGATGEMITAGQLLKSAVPLARALTAQGMRGKPAMFLMRNHQRMSAVYFANIFAGVNPFMIDPNTTVYELKHFLSLMEPLIIFCDREHYDTLKEALENGSSPIIVVVDEPGQLEQFAAGYSDDIQSYHVSDSSPEDTVMYLPTSGSTGLPKAAIMTNRGLMAQLPSPWSYHTQFPKPTNLVMISTTIQWVTFTMMVTSCVVYDVPFLLSPRKPTVEHFIEMIETYRPTWTYFSPAFASLLVTAVRPEQVGSIRSLTLLGAPATPELKASIKEKLPSAARLCDGYGTTETHGFVMVTDARAPAHSNGWVLNTFHYKIVDDDGRELQGLNQVGELYVKGNSVIKGYYKHEDVSEETFTADGWYKTGDVFRVDDDERCSFVIRKKFSFKYKGCQVSPEEVERAVCSVAGVRECVVCATDGGPAAAVVVLPQHAVTREHIHRVVNATLSDHKRLHGGIAFVESLPYTHTGKLKRGECLKMIHELINSGRCFV